MQNFDNGRWPGNKADSQNNYQWTNAVSAHLLTLMCIDYLTDLAMQCRVPPGDTSQLTTGTDSFFSTPLFLETSDTA